MHATKVIVTDGPAHCRLRALRHAAPRRRPARQARRWADLSSNAFIIATERTTLNDVITRMSRRDRSYAIVIKGNRGVPRPDDIVGIIDREEVAQAVIKNHYG